MKNKKNKPDKKITKKTTLAEVLSQEKLIPILERHQIPCLICPFAQLEMNNLTLNQIAEIYGIKLDKLLKELNRALSQKNEQQAIKKSISKISK